MGDTFRQYIFLCEWIDGELGTGNKEEYDADRKGGLQVPMFIEISKLNDIYLLADKVKYQLLEDISKYGYSFGNDIKVIEEKAKF